MKKRVTTTIKQGLLKAALTLLLVQPLAAQESNIRLLVKIDNTLGQEEVSSALFPSGSQLLITNPVDGKNANAITRRPGNQQDTSYLIMNTKMAETIGVRGEEQVLVAFVNANEFQDPFTEQGKLSDLGIRTFNEMRDLLAPQMPGDSQIQKVKPGPETGIDITLQSNNRTITIPLPRKLPETSPSPPPTPAAPKEEIVEKPPAVQPSEPPKPIEPPPARPTPLPAQPIPAGQSKPPAQFQPAPPLIKSTLPPEPPANQPVYMQIGLFASRETARLRLNRLTALLPFPLEIRPLNVAGKNNYRLLLGPLPLNQIEQAAEYLRHLQLMDQEERKVGGQAPGPLSGVRGTPDPPIKPTTPVFDDRFYIQIGAFTRQDNAYNTLNAFALDLPTLITRSVASGKNLYLVLIGPFDESQSKRYLDLVKNAGYFDAFRLKNRNYAE